MWKAVTVTRHTNMSVLIAPQVSQTIPQPSTQPAQLTIDPKATELMSMLASMMNMSNLNQGNAKKGFQSAQ